MTEIAHFLFSLCTAITFFMKNDVFTEVSLKIQMKCISKQQHYLNLLNISKIVNLFIKFVHNNIN